MAENSNEEQEKSACELIVHRARVHGPVARQEGRAQDTHVLPLRKQEEEEDEKVRVKRMTADITLYLNV